MAMSLRTVRRPSSPAVVTAVILVVLVLAFGWGTRGYDVARVGGDLDRHLKEVADGDVFSFAEFIDGCDELGLVEAYADDSQRDAVIGRAGVSMEGQGTFTLLVAFDGQGQRILAARLARVPNDLNDLGTGRFPCDVGLVAIDGRVSVAP